MTLPKEEQDIQAAKLLEELPPIDDDARIELLEGLPGLARTHHTPENDELAKLLPPAEKLRKMSGKRPISEWMREDHLDF